MDNDKLINAFNDLAQYVDMFTQCGDKDLRESLRKQIIDETENFLKLIKE